ncbi:MAG: restriction endonuclease subunit S [Bacteroidota bacterium]|nr:restriction endonuclease subunit S [Bacteroidota bacterium]
MSKIHKALPAGWKEAQLSEIAQINPGRSFDLPDDAKVSFLAMPDVTEEGRIINRQEKTLAEVKSGFTHFINGDILVAKITPCFENSKGALVHGMTNGVGFGSTEFHVIRPIDPADREFIFYHTTSHEFRVRGELHMVGSAGQKRVPADYLREYTFGFPPAEERRRISETLRTWDEAIALQTRQLQQLKRRLNKLREDLLLAKRRLTGFSKPWQEVEIGAILKEVKRRVIWNENEEYALISMRRRSGGAFLRERLFGHQILTKNLRTAHAGDFLISKRQIVHGASGLVPAELDGMKISDAYVALLPRNPAAFDINFFDCLSKLPWFYHLCYVCSHGIHIEKMMFDSADFLSRIIKVPEIDEQRAIAEILNTAEAEIRLHERKLEVLREQKRGLLQQLLTGEILLS